MHLLTQSGALLCTLAYSPYFRTASHDKEKCFSNAFTLLSDIHLTY